MEDPADVISEFLCGLPDTIRNEVLLFVLLYAIDLSPDKTTDFREEIKKHLSEKKGLKRLGSVIRLIGATDFVLERAAVVSQINDRRLSQLARSLEDNRKISEVLQRMTLGQPHSPPYRSRASAMARASSLRFIGSKSDGFREYCSKVTRPRKSHQLRKILLRAGLPSGCSSVTLRLLSVLRHGFRDLRLYGIEVEARALLRRRELDGRHGQLRHFLLDEHEAPELGTNQSKYW